MVALRQPSIEVEVRDFETGEAITVTSRAGAGLRITYDVVRTADAQPNRGTVSIYNASPTTRAKIRGKVQTSRVLAVTPPSESSIFGGTGTLFADTPAAVAQRYRYAYVTIRAGFDGVLSTVHEGSSSRVSDRNPGLDWVTTLELDDGDAALSHADAGRTFAPGSEVWEAVDYLRKESGLISGNFTRKTWDSLDTFGGVLGGAQYFATAYSPLGDPAEQLSLVLEAYGIRWFVDQGQAWLLGKDGYLPEPIVDLGVPREEPEDTDEGILVNVLHNPRIRPGVRARVNSRRSPDRVVAGVTGLISQPYAVRVERETWLIDAVRFSGDAHGELLSQVSLVPVQRVIGV